MPVHIEIFCEYLSNRIFHVLTFHLKAQFLTANKVKPFAESKQKRKINDENGKVAGTLSLYRFIITLFPYQIVKQPFCLREISHAFYPAANLKRIFLAVLHETADSGQRALRMIRA